MKPVSDEIHRLVLAIQRARESGFTHFAMALEKLLKKAAA